MKLSRRHFLALGGAVALGAGATIVTYRVRRLRAETATTMTPAEALSAAARGDILLVDIRRPDEWQRTGVGEGAVTIDMRAADFVEQLVALRQSTSQPVAVICARGVRSARVTRQLDTAGIGPIIDIPEGMLGSAAGPGWLGRGLAVYKVN